MMQYFIIGADGREYGPASMEDLRQWVRERRANAQTRVRREDETSWRRWADHPDLGGLLGEGIGGGGAAASEVPPRTLGPGEVLAQAVLSREPTLNIGDAFARGWDLLMDHMGLLVGATALMALLVFGVGSIPGVGGAIALAFSFVLLGGLNLVFLRYLRGEPADIGVVFSGFSGSVFLPLLLAGVIASALSVVGLMLCVVPGVYLIVAWGMFGPLLIMEKRLDFWQGLECSRQVVTRLWWPCFGLFLLALLVVIAGVLACGVGVLLALPLAFAAVVVAYEEVFGNSQPERGREPERLPEPQPPTPNAPADSEPREPGATIEPVAPPAKGIAATPSEATPPAVPAASPGDAGGSQTELLATPPALDPTVAGGATTAKAEAEPPPSSKDRRTRKRPTSRRPSSSKPAPRKGARKKVVRTGRKRVSGEAPTGKEPPGEPV